MTNPVDQTAIAIHIVLAFLEFLALVQSSARSLVDQERVRNLRETIVALFSLNPAMLESTPPNISDQQNGSTSASPPIQRPFFTVGSMMEINETLAFLFHYFQMAITPLGFFEGTRGDYWMRKSRAKQIFKDAISVLVEAGHVTFDEKNLADGLKILGNKAMHCEMYDNAIDLYSMALALLKDNAVYFCNRAAVLTKVGRFEDAIRDCYEAIKLKPGYVMAYYRIGCAYYEQGKNLEAIREGFLKVLELDPKNQDAMVSVELAESKLKYEVESLTRQMGKLRLGVRGSEQSSGRQSTVLVFRGPEEGGNGPWELVEDTGTANINAEDTISVADFIDSLVRNVPPPE
ncbi:uncharacterized protein LOC109804531 [Cajanus cajan]|uniref:uncharacterized protein LOC109804531 n=1 Tax=Cajanus cajan TaxID=3821 RepID=UPI00098D8201|nr:uncharacterized protein LOC109804531 [Cajanus cajan]